MLNRDADVSSLPLSIHEYKYGQNPDFLGGPFDLVLCSDLIYLSERAGKY
jgi:hypothetical protein